MNTKKTMLLFSVLKFTLLLSIFLMGTKVAAQDKIVKKGGEILEVKILEISPNEVKYYIFSDPTGPIFIMDKDRILEVVYENGRSEQYVSPLNDGELYIGQKKRALKMNFISPLLGYTQLAYEQNLKPGRSYEVSLGIIGLGQNQEINNWSNNGDKENQRGLFGSFGFKFIRVPDFTTNNQKYGHIMQGLYVKPELMLGHFGNDTYNYDTDQLMRQKTTFGAFIVNLGKQWVFSDIFLIDFYGGLGYAFKNQTKNSQNFYDYDGRLYGLLAGGDRDATIALSGGFRIGILLN